MHKLLIEQLFSHFVIVWDDVVFHLSSSSVRLFQSQTGLQPIPGWYYFSFHLRNTFPHGGGKFMTARHVITCPLGCDVCQDTLHLQKTAGDGSGCRDSFPGVVMWM